MSFLSRIHGPEGMKVILGAGLFWAWLDALFMSALFTQPEPDSMPEIATMLAFGLSIPFLTFAACKSSSTERLIANRRAVLCLSAAGSAGSFLYTYAGFTSGWIALLVGGIGCGAFLAFAATAWGATYTHGGTRWATPFIAGSFACAVIIDTPLLCMVPHATALFYSFLPLASGILFTFVNPSVKTYPSPTSQPAVPSKSMRTLLWRYLGISVMMLAAVMLVKIGFGYLQHLISFSAVTSMDRLGGTGVQVARGATALIIFFLLAFKPKASSALYRIGFLTMIAGIMMLPLAIGSTSFAISEAAIIGGYTVFDIFLWVAFSHIAYSQSKDPVKTIVVMRLISAACYVVGAFIGMLATGVSGAVVLDLETLQRTTIVGYFMVIATVLLLSSEDARGLFRYTQTLMNPNAADSLEARKEQWLDVIGLTAREKEIAVLIMQGRTQPWISDTLGISRNTVGTHMRHIYQKADVHDRQQFIDQALSHASHTLRDEDD